MADENLLNKVEVRGQKIMAHDLPKLLGFPAIDYLVNNSDDMVAVAERANEAASGAHAAQEVNDRQDDTLAEHRNTLDEHSRTLTDHEQRIAASELAIHDHEGRIVVLEDASERHDVRIGALEVTSADHETRIDTIESDYVSKSKTPLQTLASPLDVAASYSVNGVKVVGAQITGWTASTGTPYTSIFNGDKTNTAGAAYSQLVVQSIADDLKQARQRIIALESALRTHGLIA